MNYTNYVNYLKSNNIILFDHDYRISYHNINQYLEKNMIGGGNNNQKISLSKYNLQQLIEIVNISISSNPSFLKIIS
jgi:hypothetical protein